MRQGVLIYDHDTDRMDIRFDLDDYYGGLHCGTSMEVFVNNKWVPTRIEINVLKRKPEHGEKMYEVIYMTYLAPEKLSHNELLYRLNISSRHYYRLRTQAIGIISLRLWSVPSTEMDSWFEVLTLLEDLC